MVALTEIGARLSAKIYTTEPRRPDDARKPITGEVHLGPVAEEGHETTINLLKNERFLPTDITLSYAGFIGLDWIYHATPQNGGFLCDINSDQTKFWPAFFDLMGECETMEKMNGRFRIWQNWGTGRQFKYRSSYKEEPAALETAVVDYKHVWQRDPEAYTTIRNLVLAGKIAPLSMDVLDTDRHQALADLLAEKETGLTVGLQYISNIRYYCDASKGIGFYDRIINADSPDILCGNVKKLSHPGTIVIEAEHYGHSAIPLVEEEATFQLKMYKAMEIKPLPKIAVGR